jgi:hypothetical protein
MTFLGFLMSVSYTNCSQVSLEKEVPLSFASGKVSLCLQDYKPQAYYFRNLNMANYMDRALPDNDADGIPDEVESLYGMDPLRRRTFGATLDSVCLNSYGGDKTICEASAGTTCSLAEHKMKFIGISQCDLKAISVAQNAAPNSRLEGWDSDHDGIPDFIEILAGTNVLVASQADDPDNDGQTTSMEVSNFTNPNYAGSRDSTTAIQSSLTTASDPDCAGDAYQISLDSAPLTVLRPYQSVEFPKLSHGTDDNNFIFAIELVHKTNPTDPQIGRRLVYKLFKVKMASEPFQIQYQEDSSAPAPAVEEIQDGVDPQ